MARTWMCQTQSLPPVPVPLGPPRPSCHVWGTCKARLPWPWPAGGQALSWQVCTGHGPGCRACVSRLFLIKKTSLPFSCKSVPVGESLRPPPRWSPPLRTCGPGRENASIFRCLAAAGSGSPLPPQPELRQGRQIRKWRREETSDTPGKVKRKKKRKKKSIFVQM